MNPKNTKKSPIHDNADANITCDIGDGDISRLGVAYLTYVIHNYLDYTKIVTNARTHTLEPKTVWGPVAAGHNDRSSFCFSDAQTAQNPPAVMSSPPMSTSSWKLNVQDVT